MKKKSQCSCRCPVDDGFIERHILRSRSDALLDDERCKWMTAELRRIARLVRGPVRSAGYAT